MSPKVLCQRSFFYLMGYAPCLDNPHRRFLSVALPPRLQQLPAKGPQIPDCSFFGRIRRANVPVSVLDHVQHPQYLRLQARVAPCPSNQLFGLIQIAHLIHGQPPGSGLATTYVPTTPFLCISQISPSDLSFAREDVHHF